MNAVALLPRLLSTLPILITLRGYKISWLRGDMLAGLTACVVMIPSVIAYAELVHMPPVSGLYAALAASVGFALFASSRQVIAGPDAAIGLLAGTAILPLAAGDPTRIPALAAALGLLSGVILLLAARLRVGAIADFLSRPVLIGYLNGAALILVSTQLGKLFAIKTSGEEFFPLLLQILEQLPNTHRPTFLVGLSLILLMVLMAHFTPRIPGALVVSALAILGTSAFGFAEMGIALVGTVPSGTPIPVMPHFEWSDIPALSPAAMAIAFLAFSDGILLAQAFAEKNRYEINPNRELTALGMANVAAGLLQGFPVSASSSRTAIVDASGGKTQVAQLIAAAGLLLFLFFLTGLIALLPRVALGAILIVTALGMLEIKAMQDLYRQDRFEFFMAVMVIFAILLAGVVPGILLGLLISLIGVIVEISRPGDAVLRRLGPGKKFHDLGSKGASGESLPGLIVYRLYAPLIFANARHVMTRLRQLVAEAPSPVKWLVLDAQSITDMDITAAQRLAELYREFREAGITLKVADAPRPFRLQLEKVGLSDTLDEHHFYVSVKKAVEDYEAMLNPVREIRLVILNEELEAETGREHLQLTFRREGSNLTASCSCKQEEEEEAPFCNHRLAILTGELTEITLLDGSARDVKEIQNMLRGTDVEMALNSLLQADKAMQSLSRELFQAKEELGKALRD
ncbi:SulP family inorganic anion transporter [Candidatus Magnetaquicoccus inordinatus]|uniref:SulP family inorganic anion transporter n=1 Tax=Candidatus Magnetaquicoccus inordinatus TaxID=2496818 RepID=UPI00102C2C81|nr:SulP family inorganic anion transporter [Candidatus Magnetaquicoccus inordinatus]